MKACTIIRHSVFRHGVWNGSQEEKGRVSNIWNKVGRVGKTREWNTPVSIHNKRQVPPFPPRNTIFKPIVFCSNFYARP